MARIRTIKPEFWTSEQIVECSPIARLLFIGMWNFCDDAGNHPASFKTLKMEVFPGDEISLEQIKSYTEELLSNGLLVCYDGCNGREYWHVTGWHHQKIDKPNPKHPPFDSSKTKKFDDHSSNDMRTVYDHSPLEGKVMEENVNIKPKEKIIKKEIDPGLKKLLHDVDDQVIKDFSVLRKQKKAPVTESAVNGLRREAAIAGIDLQTALIECCKNGWQGFKAEWYQKAQAPPVYQTRQQIASVAARSVFGNNNEKCIDGEVIGYESTAKQLG